MTGFVSFVTSGPGNPELLTLKAVDRLQRADRVLFDDLAPGPILTHAKAGAGMVAVGKRISRPAQRIAKTTVAALATQMAQARSDQPALILYAALADCAGQD
jgi:siroheme synthase